MAASRKIGVWERRLKEIEREKARLREQLEEVRRWTDAAPDECRSPGKAIALPGEVVAAAVATAERPPDEVALDFEPGPEGLDIKRVVMPRLERTDLLRPAIGGASASTRLVEPEHDRFRNYIGHIGLKRARETRREQGSQRLRTLFMLMMVLILGFILFYMVT